MLRCTWWLDNPYCCRKWTRVFPAQRTPFQHQTPPKERSKRRPARITRCRRRRRRGGETASGGALGKRWSCGCRPRCPRRLPAPRRCPVSPRPLRRLDPEQEGERVFFLKAQERSSSEKRNAVDTDWRSCACVCCGSTSWFLPWFLVFAAYPDDPKLLSHLTWSSQGVPASDAPPAPHCYTICLTLPYPLLLLTASNRHNFTDHRDDNDDDDDDDTTTTNLQSCPGRCPLLVRRRCLRQMILSRSRSRRHITQHIGMDIDLDIDLDINRQRRSSERSEGRVAWASSGRGGRNLFVPNSWLVGCLSTAEKNRLHVVQASLDGVKH